MRRADIASDVRTLDLRFAGLLAACVLGAVLLWWSPVLLPFRLFVTMIHELSHALAAVLTGGEVQGIVIRLDGSGVTNAFLFCLDSGGLRRVQGARGVAGSYVCSGGAVLAESVTSLAFAYYDANNNPLPDPPTAPYQLDGQAVGVPSFANTTQRAAVRRVVGKWVGETYRRRPMIVPTVIAV